MTAAEAWKRHRFALAVIALVVAELFAQPLLTGQLYVFRDHADYFQPLRWFTTQHLRAGVLPFWNPYSASGEPWMANPQTGVFYPPTWLFLLLPFATAFMAYLALHLLILGWGAYLLFTRTVSEGAALAGAAIVTFCGPTLSLLDVQNNLASFAWVPLVLWCGVARVRPQLAAVLLALTFLAGEPFFAAIAALLYVITTFAAATPRAAARNVAIAGAGAFGLSAIQLLPFLELVAGSDRAAGLPRDQIFAESMRVMDWLRVAVPPRLVSGAVDPALSQHFVAVVYVGMFASALAAAGLVVGGRKTLPWLALLGGSVIVAAGNRIPLTGEIFAHLPVTPFRYPSRVVAFGALAVGALGALGWDRLRPRRRWADLIVVLVVVADVLMRVAPLLAVGRFTTDRVPYGPQVGRNGKITRIVTTPVTNRSNWLAGYLNLYQKRFDAMTAAPVTAARYARLHDAALAGGRLDLLNFIGVGYILADRPLGGIPAMARYGRVTVYANRSVPPMTIFWSKVKGYAAADEAARAIVERHQPLVLPVSPVVDARYSAAPAVVTAAPYTTLSTSDARAVIDAPADGVVMLTQQDAAAWHVYVDGVEARKLRGAGVFRAVAVKKGHHEVIWRYRARSFFVGAAMTLITAAALQLSRFVKRFRKQKFSG